MRSRLVLLALASLAACEEAPGRTRACDSASDCTAGEVCSDGTCHDPSSGLDGGGLDGATFDGGLQEAGPRPDVQCIALGSEGAQIRKPADVVLLIDSSASMGDARAQIVAVINAELDAILATEGIDYRVIVLADPSLITIGAPLSTYTPPRLFSVPISSGSGSNANFMLLLDGYDSWAMHLRPDAVKVMMHFTDATSSDGSAIDGYSGTFDAELFARHPDQFGASAAEGRFVYHAIVGLAPRDPAGTAWLPTEPIVDSTCTSPVFGVQAGQGYQGVAVRTGGLRYPVCDFEGYDAIFRSVAEAVIEDVGAECVYALPEPPEGKTLDLETVAVRYTPDGATTDEIFLQAANVADCGDARFVTDEAAGTLSLCDAACARVRADDGARVDVVFGCDPTLY